MVPLTCSMLLEQALVNTTGVQSAFQGSKVFRHKQAQLHTTACGRQHLLDPLGKALEGEALLTLVRAFRNSVFSVRHCYRTLHSASANLPHLFPYNSIPSRAREQPLLSRPEASPLNLTGFLRCAVSQRDESSVKNSWGSAQGKARTQRTEGHSEERVSF